MQIAILDMSEPKIPESLDISNEDNFTDKQKIVRRELFDFLQTKNELDKYIIAMDQIILKSCPKIS